MEGVESRTKLTCQWSRGDKRTSHMWAQPHECTNLNLSMFIKFYAKVNERFQTRVVSLILLSHILVIDKKG